VSTNDFRKEFVLALSGSASHADLLSIVLRHKAQGGGRDSRFRSTRAAYDTLESIRLELGCHKDEADENPLCERIEDIMDRVWGFCAPADAIWDSSLSEVRGE
jgi:hypothetical protein